MDRIKRLIDSFYKFREPPPHEEIDYTEFILPATEELPCLVIMPYNVAMGEITYYKDKIKKLEKQKDTQ